MRLSVRAARPPRELTLVALLAAAACASAPPQRAPPPEAPRPAPAVAPVADDGFRVSTRPQAEGHTLIEVTDPVGAEVTADEGGRQVASDSAPLSFEAEGDHFYRIAIRLPGGVVREKKVAAHSGQITSVQLISGVDTGPKPMAIDDFKRLVGMIDRATGGDVGKLSLVKTAAADNWFSAGMAAMLIDHLVYRQSKLDAVPVLKDRIVDKNNAYRIIDKFTYREDKAAVEQQLTSH
jgi:hypothetical protein